MYVHVYVYMYVCMYVCMSGSRLNLKDQGKGCFSGIGSGVWLIARPPDGDIDIEYIKKTSRQNKTTNNNKSATTQIKKKIETFARGDSG